MMRVRDVMTRKPFYLDADVTIQEVSQVMRDNDLGFVPLNKGNRIIGVVTDRDIALRVVAEGKNPHEKAQHIATERVLYTYEDTPIEDVIQNMADQQVQRFLVLNNAKNEQLVGVVTLGDIANHCKNAEMSKKVINAVKHYQ